MATVVDQLITKFTLDPGGYQSGANAVTNATHGMIGAIGGVVTRAAGLGAQLASAIGIVSFGGVIGEAAKLALSYDSLTRSLDLLTGSAERAKAILKFSDQIAGPSMFTGLEVGEGARMLEAYGLKAEKYLPTLIQLGQVLNRGPEGMYEVAHSFGEILSGRAGRGLMTLGMAGVRREDLAKRGVQFTEGEHMTTDPRQALEIIRQLVEQKFARAGQTVGQGFAAKFSTFRNYLEQDLAKVGGAILGHLVGPLQKAGQVLEEIGNSGQAERIGRAWMGLFGIDTANLTDGLQKAANFLERLPVVIGSIRDKVMGVIHPLIDNIKLVAAVMAGIWAMDKAAAMVAALKTLAMAWDAIRATAAAAGAAEAVAEMIGSAGTAAVVIAGAVAAGYSVYKALDSMQAEFGKVVAPIGEAGETISNRLTDVKNRLQSVNDQIRSGGAAAADSLRQQSVELERQVRILESQQERQKILKELGELQSKNQELEESKPSRDWINTLGSDDADIADMDKYPNKQIASNDAKIKVLLKQLAALKDKHTVITEPKQPVEDKTSPVTQTNNLLSQILEVNKQQALDLRKFAVGGGELGRYGVSAAEVSGRKMSGVSHGTTGALINAIGAAIEEALASHLGDYQRSGLGASLAR